MAPLEIFLAIILTLNLGVLFLIGILFVKIQEVLSLEKKGGRGERKFRRKLSEEIEEEASGKLTQIIEGTAKTLEQEVKGQVVQFKDMISRQLSELATHTEEEQKAIGREAQLLVANIVMRAEKELEDYKQNQLSKIDRQITQIVVAAAREVLGRAISLSEHEDLVNKALERAKKDKFFS